jgi:hypothetical protein
MVSSKLSGTASSGFRFCHFFFLLQISATVRKLGPKIVNKVKLNQAVKFTCEVECANPNDFNYKWNLIIKFNNKTNNNESVTTKSNRQIDTFVYTFNKIFDNAVIECCVTNGVENNICKKIDILFDPYAFCLHMSIEFFCFTLNEIIVYFIILLSALIAVAVLLKCRIIKGEKSK